MDIHIRRPDSVEFLESESGWNAVPVLSTSLEVQRERSELARAAHIRYISRLYSAPQEPNSLPNHTRDLIPGDGILLARGIKISLHPPLRSVV
ncbi:uncharacterized protein BT62DRAFT_1012772 [Guyanagaster necrorhizus]|uniref:Uncharacterized protein n=1 Tax=Guyanagaster necrorhizus TaxID=856835 RepID=A0A9P8AM17_9AGAR|nr:uncharacterized protein BT62DRAFT_1012772 [Guyanagaster necrorhizus MCA 3950]KAG7440405.1 hypothetical protein BT62DRAFT_1012772 [Guyanagaster necrorhizus MCA 3950]